MKLSVRTMIIQNRISSTESRDFRLLCAQQIDEVRLQRQMRWRDRRWWFVNEMIETEIMERL